MQKTAIKKQVVEQITELKQFFDDIAPSEHLTPEECELLLNQLHLLVRNMAVYTHVINQPAEVKELDIQMKEMEKPKKESEIELEIIQNPEPVFIRNTPDIAFAETAEATQVKNEKPIVSVPKSNTNSMATLPNTKRVEVAINDKYRFINELFETISQEYNAAIEELNAIETWREAEEYLNSLKEVYEWKDNNPLVKTFYSVAQKRFL